MTTTEMESGIVCSRSIQGYSRKQKSDARDLYEQIHNRHVYLHKYVAFGQELSGLRKD